jgi:hypothetical protein
LSHSTSPAATWEVEIRMIAVHSHPGKKAFDTPSQSINWV